MGIRIKEGDVLEIVGARSRWISCKDWNGRFVVAGKKERESRTFYWISPAPEKWHDKKLFTLKDIRGVFRRVRGRAK